MFDIAIIGGGLAGLVNSILLSRAGLKVVLFEKNQYPFHRVCGEYISNEVIPFLENHDLFPLEFAPPNISELLISSVRGKSFSSTLDLGGFGISRFAFDHWLSLKAEAAGVQVYQNTTIKEVRKSTVFFELSTQNDEVFTSKLVIGAHGKRAKLDQSLNRSFLQKHSPYVGVKYHVKTNLPDDQIALHNFEGGYCGVSRVEDGKYNVCYLTHRDGIREHGSIEAFEENIMYRNPHLESLFRNSDKLFEKPLVINEISFDKREPINGSLFMCGDAAGMITPLCGNGMAMAIHSAKILSSFIIDQWKSGDLNLEALGNAYEKTWTKQFGTRLWAGLKIQDSLFGNNWASSTAVFTGKYLKPLTDALIRQTHGSPFS